VGGVPESRDPFSGKSGKSCHHPVPCRVLEKGFLLLKDMPDLACGDPGSETCVKRQSQLKNP